MGGHKTRRRGLGEGRTIIRRFNLFENLESTIVREVIIVLIVLEDRERAGVEWAVAGVDFPSDRGESADRFIRGEGYISHTRERSGVYERGALLFVL